MIVAVAAVSARAMAESARRAGFEVVALDCFGDADTRRASRRWIPIAAADTLEIDGDRLVDELRTLAREEPLQAWVPGAGLESQPQTLERAASVLTMAGTAADEVKRVRDPHAFFAALDAAGIAHPELRASVPDDPRGWLVKRSGGRGGWHVRPAASLAGAPLPEDAYLQREGEGVPMSATFLADGRHALMLGINRQLVQRIGARPYVFRGVIGPVAIPPAAQAEVRRALQRLVAEFALRGLGSLDFLLDGDTVAVLEINPRPPASFVLHEHGESLIAAHLAACLEARLPAAKADDARVRGIEFVYARRGLRVDAAALQRLAAWRGCHDLPFDPRAFAAGDPVCSLAAEGDDAQAVEAALARSRDDLLTMLETMDD